MLESEALVAVSATMLLYGKDAVAPTSVSSDQRRRQSPG